MGRSKNINILLKNGNPNGLIRCSLTNLIGRIYKVQRDKLQLYNNEPELKQSGVYILFGENIAYVGQAGARKNGEGTLNRLSEHNKNKDYWDEAIIITTSNNSLGQTEIVYLENRLYNIAKECDRVDLKNGNEPMTGNITEEKESELEEFIDYIKMIIGTLGYSIFIPLESIKNTKIDNEIIEDIINTEESNIYYIKRNTKDTVVDAKCRQTNEGFVVLKGSMIRINDVNSTPTIVVDKKLEMKQKGKIDKNNRIKEDILFNSLYLSASFVFGRSVNGKDVWKNSDGISIKELEKLKNK